MGTYAAPAETIGYLGVALGSMALVGAVVQVANGIDRSIRAGQVENAIAAEDLHRSL